MRQLLDGVRRRRAAAQRRRHLRLAERHLAIAATTPAWTSPVEREELALACRSLGGNPTVVEIGAFVGSSTAILAGVLHDAGRGMVHTIDPFDGSGDAHSAPIYQQMIGDMGVSARARFDRTIAEAGVADRLTVHVGTAESVIGSWTAPIDLLFLDGDQSPAGARSAFDLWEPWLRVGGLIVLTNSAPREFAEHHDGQFLVASRLVVPPRFVDRRVVGNWTFARKATRRDADG